MSDPPVEANEPLYPLVISELHDLWDYNIRCHYVPDSLYV